MDESADLAALQNELAHDDSFEVVARVPIRYLQMPKKTLKNNQPASAIAAIPPNSGDMWNLDRVRWQQARQLSDFRDADSVKVAVLDSGIQENHPDLIGRIASYAWNYSDLNVQSGPGDVIGHGTHVAGTIMANFDNNYGIKGICNCELHAYKIFDDTPDFFPFPVPHFTYFVNPLLYRRALAECVINKMNVVNLSIGGPGQPDPIESQLFGALMQNGTSVVAAMGNKFQDGNPISYPAAIPGVIAVGATNINDSKASFSNTGNHIALSAPGTGIWSTLPTYPGHSFRQAIAVGNGDFVPGSPIPRETDYAAWDGTSMATPHVAAAAALLISNGGSFNGQEVKAKLQATARKLPDMNDQDFTSYHGSGCLELEKLLGSVLAS
ncbi:MAG: S8 family serine peptidase [Pseudomonadota bacterium]